MTPETVAEPVGLLSAEFVQDEVQLRAIYKQPTPIAKGKEIDHIDRYCRSFIGLSPFVCIGTMSRNGRADVSPRGGASGFVEVLDEHHLALPDRPGNNRLDSLLNILEQPSVGLLFFVPGFEDMLRVNGRAWISLHQPLLERFFFDGKLPLSVLLVEVHEAQLHCTKAIKRAALWDAAAQRDRRSFPSLGQILHDQLALDRGVAELDTRLEEGSRILY